jgi:hypothetical protein
MTADQSRSSVLSCYDSPRTALTYTSIHYRINNITHTTVAVRDIQPGEELSVSYIDATLDRDRRQERLRENWGFECECAQCQKDDLESALSDGRLARIKSLERDLDNFQDMHATADTGGELVALYEKERLHIYLGPAYTRAALNYALFGDAKKASEYAAIAVEAVSRENGPQAADVEPMRVLAADPERHWSWGKRRTDDFE